jgi:hypothetical protein
VESSKGTGNLLVMTCVNCRRAADLLGVCVVKASSNTTPNSLIYIQTEMKATYMHHLQINCRSGIVKYSIRYKTNKQLDILDEN